MGIYLNPGNSGFVEITNGDYIDKTGMIELINAKINTPKKLICVSRPRRFGKSYAAQMLCAYYDCTCDSDSLFHQYQIADSKTYKEYLKQYNVIYLDISGFVSDVKRKNGDLRTLTDDITTSVRDELMKEQPELKELSRITDCFIAYVEKTKKKLVFIIDEWDAVIRESGKDEETQITYLNLLREWFKNGNLTSKVVACAYMTGILPIKKDGF